MTDPRNSIILLASADVVERQIADGELAPTFSPMASLVAWLGVERILEAQGYIEPAEDSRSAGDATREDVIHSRLALEQEKVELNHRRIELEAEMGQVRSDSDFRLLLSKSHFETTRRLFEVARERIKYHTAGSFLGGVKLVGGPLDVTSGGEGAVVVNLRGSKGDQYLWLVRSFRLRSRPADSAPLGVMVMPMHYDSAGDFIQDFLGCKPPPENGAVNDRTLAHTYEDELRNVMYDALAARPLVVSRT